MIKKIENISDDDDDDDNDDDGDNNNKDLCLSSKQEITVPCQVFLYDNDHKGHNNVIRSIPRTQIISLPSCPK